MAALSVLAATTRVPLVIWHMLGLGSRSPRSQFSKFTRSHHHFVRYPRSTTPFNYMVVQRWAPPARTLKIATVLEVHIFEIQIRGRPVRSGCHQNRAFGICLAWVGDPQFNIFTNSHIRIIRLIAVALDTLLVVAFNYGRASGDRF